jgi:Tfp pilus assembly PilM family ATPase
MRTLLNTVDQIRERFLTRSYGWTGVEIGCHCLNMAQVRKVQDRWQLAAVWSVDHPATYSVKADSNHPVADETFGWLSSEDILEFGLSSTVSLLDKLDSLFIGNACAATLNDGLISYRELELPSSDESDSQSMVRSEVATEIECDLEDVLTDCWALPQNRPCSTTTSYGTVSLKRSSAMVLANDLLHAGFECQILDAMPCAMARATCMAVENSNNSIQSPTLAIDLGYQHATITLVDNGRPIMTRILRNSGLLQLLTQISATFEVSLADAQTLLFQSPTSRAFASDRSDEFTDPLQQKRNAYLMALTSEFEKTIVYISRTYRECIPSQILLMGGGVRIPNLKQAIEHRTEMPTDFWAIDTSSNLFGLKHAGVYAIASGLSALAWEGF